MVTCGLMVDAGTPFPRCCRCAPGRDTRRPVGRRRGLRQATGTAPSAGVFVGVAGCLARRQLSGFCCPWCAKQQQTVECRSAPPLKGVRGSCAGRARVADGARGHGDSSSGSPTTHHSSVSESV
jgi:hypothetical protein